MLVPTTAHPPYTLNSNRGSIEIPAAETESCTLKSVQSATDIRLILSTAGTREEAERIARSLVEDGLAACVNLVPGVMSVYRWQAGIEAADEILLIIKTAVSCVERVEAALGTLHSYEVPEFLVLHPESVSQPYLEWLLTSLP